VKLNAAVLRLTADDYSRFSESVHFTGIRIIIYGNPPPRRRREIRPYHIGENSRVVRSDPFSRELRISDFCLFGIPFGGWGSAENSGMICKNM